MDECRAWHESSIEAQFCGSRYGLGFKDYGLVSGPKHLLPTPHGLVQGMARRAAAELNAARLSPGGNAISAGLVSSSLSGPA